MKSKPIGDGMLGAATVAAFARSSSASGSGATGVDLRVTSDDVARVAAAHATLERVRETGSVYGLTTGVGALRQVQVDVDQTHDEHGRRLWRSHAAGLGPELDDTAVRATMLIRLRQLLRGGAGVHPALVQALAEALRRGAVPRLRTYGCVGTADLTVLAQLGLTLVGELPWRDGGPPPTTLATGDALPFLSSNAMTLGVAALQVTELAAALRALEAVAALSHLAVRGSRQAFDSRVHDAKGDATASAVAERMRHLLSGPPRLEARIQDSFGLRVLPQVHAAAEDAARHALDVLDVEINAAAENPLVVERDVLHHGQFVTQRLASALDALRAAAIPVLTLSHARLSALLDPRVTALPAFLADGPAGSSGLMITEYVAADLLTRSAALASNVTAHRTVLSLGLEEHASHSTFSAWQTRDLLSLVPDLVSCELVAAVRALRMAPDRLVDQVPAGELFWRAAWDVEQADHILGPELAAGADLFRSLVSGLLALP